jgi:hypothetical protein
VEGLFVQGGDDLGIGEGDAVLDRFQVATEVGQGRTELVGDVGDHRAAQALGAGQVAGHGVEGAGQLADLVFGDDGDALVEVAGVHAAHGGGQGVDRLEDALGDGQAQGEGGDAPDERTGGEGPLDGAEEAALGSVDPRRADRAAFRAVDEDVRRWLAGDPGDGGDGDRPGAAPVGEADDFDDLAGSGRGRGHGRLRRPGGLPLQQEDADVFPGEAGAGRSGLGGQRRRRARDRGGGGRRGGRPADPLAAGIGDHPALAVGQHHPPTDGGSDLADGGLELEAALADVALELALGRPADEHGRPDQGQQDGEAERAQEAYAEATQVAAGVSEQ